VVIGRTQRERAIRHPRSSIENRALIDHDLACLDLDITARGRDALAV
jgi:hypothetical protein